jgi:hypothetical protein
VYPQSWPAPPAGAGNGDIDGSFLVGVEQMPDDGRGSVADRGVFTARKHRGHLASERHQREMAYRVNASMEAVKVVLLEPSLDGSGADPHRKQLFSRHHAVLPASQVADEAILWDRPAPSPGTGELDNSQLDPVPHRPADLLVRIDGQPRQPLPQARRT